MFSFLNWRKPKWQHTDTEVRRKAIERLEDEQVLLQVIDSEQDQALVHLALDRLREPASLDLLMHHELEPIRSHARNRRLQQLLPDDAPGALERIRDEQELLLVAALSEDDTVRTAAIERIQDPQKRFELAATHPVASVRYAAAEGIEDIPSLEALGRRTRGHDKRVYRLCRSRIDAFRAAERERHERDAAIAAWLTQAGQLADRVADDDTQRRLTALLAQWRQLDMDASDGQRQAAEHEIERIRRGLDGFEARARADQAQALALEHAGNAREQVINELARTLAQTRETLDTETLNEMLETVEARWAAACALAAAEPGERQRLDALRDEARRLIRPLASFTAHETQLSALCDELRNVDQDDHSALRQALDSARRRLRGLAWPEGVSKPDGLRALESEAAALQVRLEDLGARQNELVQLARTQLTAVQDELDAGSVRNARQQHGTLLTTIKRLDRRHQQGFQGDLQRLAAGLRDLRDWQSFATDPKRVELCEQMESLVGATLGAEPLAERIRELQAQWKALGGGEGRNNRELWKRFKSAADAAYEPCKVHFEQQGELRRERYAQRIELCEQLEQYEAQLDWSQADWPVVQKTLNAAREAFRELSPVERGAHHKSQRRFNAITDRIYAHLKDEYDRNLARKQSLAERVEALVEHPDLGEAMEQAKAAQAQWREVGITPRGPDQRLWRRFRSACDAVFARREDQRNARKAAIDDSIGLAEQVVEDASARITTLLDRPDSYATDDDGESQRVVEQAHERLAGLELPRRVLQRAQARLDELERLLQERARDARLKAESARWQALADNLRACAHAASGEQERAGELWRAGAELPYGVDTAALARRFATPEAEFDIDLARRLCICMEILAGLEGPAEEQELRMHIQMQRLARGLGRGDGDNDQESLDIINEWLLSAPRLDWEKRFVDALLSLEQS
ncbi:MAG: DUF349 domain-containing protein [Gammaproteobacteria bacterium]|nr:DUF349 domain-containing protein [Gammaproteobacteria bacterium]